MSIKIACLSIERYIYRSMSNTPFFSAWRSRFNRRPSARVSARVGDLRRCTLDKLEERFSPLLSGLNELSAASASRRERPYSPRRTWWCFLWQMLQCNAPCRDVVRQLQAMLVLEGRPTVDEKTSAYCQARARLPEPLLLAFAERQRQGGRPADTSPRNFAGPGGQSDGRHHAHLVRHGEEPAGLSPDCGAKPGLWVSGDAVARGLECPRRRGARSRQRQPSPRRDAPVAPTRWHAQAARHRDLRPGGGKLRGLRPLAGQPN